MPSCSVFVLVFVLEWPVDTDLNDGFDVDVDVDVDVGVDVDADVDVDVDDVDVDVDVDVDNVKNLLRTCYSHYELIKYS